MRRVSLIVASVVGMVVGVVPSSVRAEPVDPQYEETIERGLKWLVRTQHPDGHWEGPGGLYPVTMTSLSGMAFLQEGSTLREGRFQSALRKATDWLMAQAQRNGLLVDTRRYSAGKYMYGHGFSMMFLASVYGSEREPERRAKLERILSKAAKFTRDAQTQKMARVDGKVVRVGGWGYVSAKDGSNFDEGSVTVTQVQALRAARNAAIAVPPKAISEAILYLKAATNARGGVRYSLDGSPFGQGRPALTAAAICCSFSAGQYNSPLVKKWFRFCRQRIPYYGKGSIVHSQYTHYYFAQSLYMLGDHGWANLFPDDPPEKRLTWSGYRKVAFEYLKRTQLADGSWASPQVGSAFATPVHLTILQMDKAVLPIYQR